MKKMLILLIMLCLVPTMVSARCTDKEIINMTSLVKNVNFTPIFDENSETFTIIVSNLDSSFYFIDTSNNITYNTIGDEAVISGYKPGTSYRFKFLSRNPNCIDRTLSSRYINTPVYNKYYKDPICNGMETYKFCKKWPGYSYSYETIKKEVDKIKNQNKEKEEEKNKEEVLGIYDYIFMIYKNYYFIILPVLIFVCLLVIVNKKKKDSLF